MSGVKRSYSTQEVLEQIFADHDSDEEDENELIKDILEDDSRCDDEEENDNDEPSDEPLYFLNKVTTRGGPNPLLNRRQGARTRGGRHGSSSRGESKEQKQNRLEEKWKAEDMEPIVPIFTGNSGVQVTISENPGALEIFKLFATDDFYDILVEQTNLYASQYIEMHPELGPHSFAKKWRETNREEMGKFLALSLLMGIVKKPSIRHYWSLDPLLKGSVFNSVMGRNRFQAILGFLHFANNEFYDPDDPRRDRLYKIRPVVEYLVTKFKTVYLPTENVCIDEELLLWKGRLIVKQYIPSKRYRFGIKLFSLCEDSGYLWNSYIYLGKNENLTEEEKLWDSHLGKSGAVVPRLMNGLFGVGYKLYLDNWYTSHKLFSYLEENGTAACGTARANRIDLPGSFKKAALPKGEFRFRRSDNQLAI